MIQTLSIDVSSIVRELGQSGRLNRPPTLMLQECTRVHSRKCETVYDEECKVHYQYGRQCKKVPRQECKDVTVSLL